MALGGARHCTACLCLHRLATRYRLHDRLQYQRDLAAGCAPESDFLTDHTRVKFTIPGEAGREGRESREGVLAGAVGERCRPWPLPPLRCQPASAVLWASRPRSSLLHPASHLLPPLRLPALSCSANNSNLINQHVTAPGGPLYRRGLLHSRAGHAARQGCSRRSRRSRCSRRRWRRALSQPGQRRRRRRAGPPRRAQHARHQPPGSEGWEVGGIRGGGCTGRGGGGAR